MHAQLIRVIRSSANHQPIPLTTSGGGDEIPADTAAPDTPGNAAMHLVLRQIAQSLTVLRSAIEQVPDGPAIEPTAPALQRWLPPHARQVEAAMRRLRGLCPEKTSGVIDLSQALTVLVLAADMLA